MAWLLPHSALRRFGVHRGGYFNKCAGEATPAIVKKWLEGERLRACGCTHFNVIAHHRHAGTEEALR